MKRNIVYIFLLMFVIGLVGCVEADNDESGTITVIVVDYENETVFEDTIEFNKDDTLVELLQEHEDIHLVGEEQAIGFFIHEVCGISALDYPETFWYVAVNGESSLVGISEISLQDNDEIKLSLIDW